MNKLEIIQEYQCPGCVNGSDPQTCEKFKLFEQNLDNWFKCENHWPGTSVNGQQFHLGLPKPFALVKIVAERAEKFAEPFFRFFQKNKHPMYGTDFYYGARDIPVWALEQNGFLFVQVYSPRVKKTVVEIIEGGKISDLPTSVVNVSDLSF